VTNRTPNNFIVKC